MFFSNLESRIRSKIAGGKDGVAVPDWIKSITYFNPQLTYRKKNSGSGRNDWTARNEPRIGLPVLDYSTLAREPRIDAKDCGLNRLTKVTSNRMASCNKPLKRSDALQTLVY